MTSEDIKNVTFETAKRGYVPEDVDDFLVQAARQLEETEQQLAAARAAQADAENKMYVLADKMEEYRDLEETLKTALINAQRMGETVVHEAKQKADNMIREATNHSELLHQQAEQDIAREQLTLEKLQTEVTRFKATILNLYKQHIESLSELDAPVERAEEVLVDEEFQSISAAQPAEEAEYAEEAAPAEGEFVYEEQQVQYEAPAEGEYQQQYDEQGQPQLEEQFLQQQQQYQQQQYQQQPQQYQQPQQQAYPQEYQQQYPQQGQQPQQQYPPQQFQPQE